MLGAGQSDAAEAKAIAPLAATLAAGPAAQRARLPDLSRRVVGILGPDAAKHLHPVSPGAESGGIKWICWPRPARLAVRGRRSDFVGVCNHYGQNAYPLETMELMRTSGVDQFRDEVL